MQELSKKYWIDFEITAKNETELTEIKQAIANILNNVTAENIKILGNAATKKNVNKNIQTYKKFL
jgi:type III secretory pathway lipoprotein EscJ